MKASSLKAMTVTLAMIISATAAVSLSPMDRFSVVVVTFLCATCGWNVFAFFCGHSMWPRRFKELDANGKAHYRLIVFWSTLVFYYCTLIGIIMQSNA